MQINNKVYLSSTCILHHSLKIRSFFTESRDALVNIHANKFIIRIILDHLTITDYLIFQ